MKPAMLLFSNPTSEIQSTISPIPDGIPCACLLFAKQSPHLFEGTQHHLLIHHARQGTAVLPSHLLPVVLQNARNATLPTEDFVDLKMEDL